MPGLGSSPREGFITGKGYRWNQPRGVHRAEPMRGPKRCSLFPLWSRGRCVTSSQPQNVTTRRALVPRVLTGLGSHGAPSLTCSPSPSQRAATPFRLSSSGGRTVIARPKAPITGHTAKTAQWPNAPGKQRHQPGREVKARVAFGEVNSFFKFIYFNWRLITLQYCSGFCHTLTWISHGCTRVPHPEHPASTFLLVRLILHHTLLSLWSSPI